MAAAAAPTPVAYEDPSDNYERRVRKILERLGSADPDGDIAACGDYVARARDAEIDPQVVASTVWLKTHEKEGPAPGSRFGRTSAWGAEERPGKPGFYAVAPNGKIVSGPYTERHLAKPHADKVNGYIQFEPGDAPYETKMYAAERGPALRDLAAASDLLGDALSLGIKDHNRLVYDAMLLLHEASGEVSYAQYPAARAQISQGMEALHSAKSKLGIIMGKEHVDRAIGLLECDEGASAKAAATSAADVVLAEPRGGHSHAPCSGAADCGCGGAKHEAPPPPPEPVAILIVAEEQPFTKELHWHRDPKVEQKYSADAGHLGRLVLERRTPDRRKGVLPWSLTRHKDGKVDAVNGSKGRRGGKWDGYDSKSDAQGFAARYAHKPYPLTCPPAAAETTAAAEPPPARPGDCIAIVERMPGCAIPGRVLEDPEDVYELLHARYERQGHEVYEVLLLNLNDELIGSPVQVASGQRSKVMVDIEQVLAPVVKGAEAGCVSFYAIHGHPSGSADGSDKDKDLTKRIAAGAAAACPATEFKDHLVLGYKEVYSCKKGKIVYRAK